jgi:DNA-binding transcriptional LysR family regulator
MAADIHTRQLRYFLAVAESGSYREAARRLYVSQPTLSRAVKHLEQILGTRLFDRSTRGTELTADGFSVIEPARRLVESLDRAGARISPSADTAPTWRIAYTPETLERALGCLVSTIAQAWPEQELVCHEMSQAEVADAVLTRACDFGLGIGSAPEAGLSGQSVGRDPLAAFVEYQLYWADETSWADWGTRIAAETQVAWCGLALSGGQP